MNDKRWTYNQITAATEKKIRAILALAQKARDDDAHGVADIFAYQAEGVFEGWSEITMGWTEGTDVERLRALTLSARQPE